MDLWGPYFAEQPMLAIGLRLTPVVLVAGLFIFFSLFYLKIHERASSAPQKERLILSGLSALFSYLYFSYFLHHSPQVIDATFYFLEAKLFSQGLLSFPEQEWASLLNGRFTLAHAADATKLSVLFPPGYPLILSLFIVIGLPFICGPALAAGITYSTMALAHKLTHSNRISLVAGILSTGCLALRFHTADTMSHGLSCLLAVVCLFLSLDAKSKGGLFLLGVCLGFSISTRQLTGGVLLFASVFLLFERRCFKGILLLVPGLMLGIFPLFFYHYEITGNLLQSPQSLYYHLADAPEDCFGLGLGKGCLFEHGQTVEAQGGEGLTLTWMLRNSFHRLWWLSLDLFSFELLFPLAVFGSLQLGLKRNQKGLLLWLACLVVAYALFYFNGSIAGGGARLFSELLPLLHIGLAQQLVRLRWETPALCCSLFSLIFHGQFTHLLLRQNGHQIQAHWEDTPTASSWKQTLVALSDHSFALNYVPQTTLEGRARAPHVIRKTDPARLAEFTSRSKQQLVNREGQPYFLNADTDFFEAEAGWPLTQAEGVTARPYFFNDDCISGRQGILLSFKGEGVNPRETRLEPYLSGYFAPQSEHSPLLCQLQLWTATRRCFQLKMLFNEGTPLGLMPWTPERLKQLKMESGGQELLIDGVRCFMPQAPQPFTQ